MKIINLTSVISVVLFSAFIYKYEVRAVRCFCHPDGASGQYCGNSSACEEEEGACYVMTERRDSGVEVSYGCLKKSRLQPPNRPLICEEIKGGRTVIDCCFKDHCNTNNGRFFPTNEATKKPDGGDTAVQSRSLTLVEILGTALGCLMFLITIVLLVLYIRKRNEGKMLMFNSPSSSNTPKEPLPMSTSDLDETNPQWTNSGSGAGLPLLVHRTIARQIHLQEVIGKGRYGEVFRGKWHGEDVAVKKFVTRDEQSWFREAEIYQTVMLRHDNILGYIAADNKDVGTWTELWLVSEYHENGSLFDYLNVNRINVAAMFKLVGSMASGLAHLHMEIVGTQGKPPIAHRDFKSKNILVKRNGECAIADLGLAVRHDSTTDIIDIPLNSKVGTKRYMAPEVLDDRLNMHHFDSFKRADIYSFGLVLWEISRRCDIGDQDLVYQLPYYDCVPDDPSFEVMRNVVCDQQRRPQKEDMWIKYDSMNGMWRIMQECWYDTASARLTALRVKKTIARMQQEEGIKV